jgi:hypothetical protein
MNMRRDHGPKNPFNLGRAQNISECHENAEGPWTHESGPVNLGQAQNISECHENAEGPWTQES